MKNLLLSLTLLLVGSSMYAQLRVLPNATSSTDSYIYVDDEILYVEQEIFYQKIPTIQLLRRAFIFRE